MYISCIKLYRKYQFKTWGALQVSCWCRDRDDSRKLHLHDTVSPLSPAFLANTVTNVERCATVRKYLSSKKIFKRVKVNIYLSWLSSHPCLRYGPIWSLVTSLLCVQVETHRTFKWRLLKHNVSNIQSTFTCSVDISVLLWAH